MQAIRCGTFLHRSYNWTKGKSKNRWFLAAFFSIFLSLLKEIWPPEAYMQDAGAARNRRTENGPSGTPAPTGCATGDMARYVWAGCAHRGRSNAGRGSGSGERRGGNSLRNLFAPQLQLDEREIQKPLVFGGVLFHISFAVERNMAAGGIHAGRGCSPQSENRKRAVGDAGPYGVRDRRHGEIRVGGVCPLGAFKRGTRERVAFSGGL